MSNLSAAHWRPQLENSDQVKHTLFITLCWLLFIYLQENCRQILQFPNFNFNSSHHGDYVGIASEPLCIVGLDIVSHAIPKRETAIEFVMNFSSCFTSLEWNNIINAGPSNAILDEFYRYERALFVWLARNCTVYLILYVYSPLLSFDVTSCVLT